MDFITAQNFMTAQKLCYSTDGSSEPLKRRKDGSDVWGLQALSIPLVAPSLGGVESLITRPSTTTHVGMSHEEKQVGI